MTQTGIIQIDTNGAKYETEFTDNYLENIKYKLPEQGQLKAVIPGLITDIKVSSGSKLKKGKTILVLEAMKMLNDIFIDFDIIVKDISVSVGDIVVKNQLLITYERAE
ncbi:MAG: acetyl-CoA carboxylase biotin carboxyl carrier protein subunit [Candidatus Delongbacteria bacterium]|nr:acetyl-CoA carboxylase biotin carboxyl carrier protein subunit [Candidatus Delongbacteria bacterium]MBN2835828.1 acetyl-CoA carboxylase biotin carboxyl carrier protein subunit [Candidatus Delongbacteria bacterium]